MLQIDFFEAFEAFSKNDDFVSQAAGGPGNQGTGKCRYAASQSTMQRCGW